MHKHVHILDLLVTGSNIYFGTKCMDCTICSATRWYFILLVVTLSFGSRLVSLITIVSVTQGTLL